MEYDLLIIGFGISGIATARWAQKNGLNYKVLEKNDTFGGVWANTWDYTNLQTDKIFYQFSELRYDKSIPSFPAKHQLLDYFNNYIEKFNLLHSVDFNVNVENLHFNYEKKLWIVETGDADKVYKSKYVAVCSGFFHNKREIPMIKQSNENDRFNRKFNRKLIVGNGASATDYLKHYYRKGALDDTEYHLVYSKDKYYANFITRSLPAKITINPIYLGFFKHLPLPIFHSLFKFFFTFNKRVPSEKINYTNIIKNDFIYFLESIGKLKLYKKKIERVEGNTVTFSDNSTEKYDEIINMAGYKRNIPFITPKIEDINTELGYNYCLPKSTKKYPQLAFIGFAPSYNWVMVSEAQAKWFTESIKNDNFPDIKTTNDFISEKSKLKNSNQVFNDLTYESLQFARENGITNQEVEGIFKLFNINNVYLTILISVMGITLITLKDYPNLITILFLIYLSAYVKVLDKTKGEKWRLVLTGLIFTIYGTMTESIIIGKTGILNYITSVKPTISGLNFPLFLPLVYFFWACIVAQIYETINYK